MLAPTGRTDAGYRAGLDGLRALAVAAVLLFHLDRMPGGNLGVDAFFVISGWLITWRLLHQADGGDIIHPRQFWAARLRRLLPASAAVLLIVAVVWPVVGISVPSLRHDIMWAAAWASNWGTISGGGDYWARFGNPSPVTHFWSLAIEEQFYFVWPLVLLAAVRFTRPHRLVVGLVSLAGTIGSIVLMNAIFDPSDPTATYMNTFARAHSLLIGAAAAAVTATLANGHLRGGRMARRLAPVAAVVCVAIVAAASEQATWLFHWGFPLFALAMVIVVVAVADGAGQTLLASAPLRWVGDRSYGIYLWHWPVFLLLSASRLAVPNSTATMAAFDIGRVALAVLLADLSYRFLETPIRRKYRLQRWHAPVAAGLALGILAVLAFTIVPGPAPTSSASEITLPPPPTITATSATPTTQGAATAAPATSTPAAPAPATIPATPLPPLRVLVTGDSTAVQLSKALLSFADAHPDQLVAGSAAFPGCGLTAGSDGRLHAFTNASGARELIDLSGCLSQWQSVPRRVVDEAIDVVLVDIGPWDTVDIHLADGSVVSVGDPRGQQLVADAYRQFTAQVEAAGAKIVWITPADTHLGWGRVDDPLNDPARWSAIRGIIDGLNVVQVDLPGWLTSQGLNGQEGRPDGVHLAPGLDDRFVAEQVAPTLASVNAQRNGQ